VSYQSPVWLYMLCYRRLLLHYMSPSASIATTIYDLLWCYWLHDIQIHYSNNAASPRMTGFHHLGNVDDGMDVPSIWAARCGASEWSFQPQDCWVGRIHTIQGGYICTVLMIWSSHIVEGSFCMALLASWYWKTIRVDPCFSLYNMILSLLGSSLSLSTNQEEKFVSIEHAFCWA